MMGDANPDLVLRGDVIPRFGQAEQLLSSADLTLGGSAAITAHGLARLGRSTRLAAIVGADMFGDLVCSALDAQGVDVSAVQRRRDQPTGVTVVLAADSDRAILTYLGTIPSLTLATAMAELDRAAHDQAQHLHVSSFYLQPELAGGLAQVFARAHQLGLTTSLDTNYDPAGRWVGIRPVLPYLDFILPNRAEVLALASALDATPVRDPVGAGRVLAASGPVVVIKDGPAGAMMVAPDGTVMVEPGRVAVAVDATGAGDTFVAAYLDARLAGRVPRDCLRRAVAAGARAVTAVGGTGGQPTRAQLDHDVSHPGWPALSERAHRIPEDGLHDLRR